MAKLILIKAKITCDQLPFQSIKNNQNWFTRLRATIYIHTQFIRCTFQCLFVSSAKKHVAVT